MLMTVGGSRFNVVLGDSDAARAFQKLLPLTLKMEELNGNEKHGELPKPLPVSASRPGTIRRGDLMLYGSSTLVVFYATFDSPYSYTRVGRVADLAGLAEALGRGDARVSFSIPQALTPHVVTVSFIHGRPWLGRNTCRSHRHE